MGPNTRWLLEAEHSTGSVQSIDNYDITGKDEFGHKTEFRFFALRNLKKSSKMAKNEESEPLFNLRSMQYAFI